ncbi:MAG: hypothetical protein HYR84_02225 [Planctomycetes bacterium]|nr:hypothetical protein [Planctomycetota bacterium]
MRKRFFANPRAVVQAATIEIGVSDSSAEVTVICGHCGKMTVETVMHTYSSPEECGVSYEEQDHTWRSNIGETQVCRHCNVLNVMNGVEDYLRQRREAEAQAEALETDFLKDFRFPE